MLTFKSKNISHPSPPVTRNSLLWLLVVQLFVFAPHFLSVPYWIAIVWLGVCLWRLKIFQGAWDYPGKLSKTFLVLICSAGLVISLQAKFSLMAMISLLLLGSILKLLEIKTRKDFVLLIFIAFFVLATQFIFFNSFLAAAYGFVCLVVLCSAVMQLYQSASLSFFSFRLRATLFILLQAVPILVILFVVMPRLGAFWSMPAPQHAKTGMSDSMSPGDISELIQSDELAFRVTFAGEIPAHEKLYWRSLVLSNFDGRRWSLQPSAKQDLQSSLQPIAGWRAKINYKDEVVTYNIIAEPSGQPWLHSLGAAKVWSGDLLLGRDLHLQSSLPLNNRISYQVTAALDYGLDVTEQETDISREYLQLPGSGNPETRRIAREWFAETGTPERLIEKLFSYYQSAFFYTLQPPLLGENYVDEFLWQSRQGFCEHFSGSFVFFMRAAGIPARVVVGYQGGELNPAENYLIVSQRDAHAWAEVWIKGRGWVMYDPTAAVAPERIRKGIVESLNATDQKRLAMPLGVSFKWLMFIHNQWDAFNFQWVRWVMNYDSNLQSTVLTRLLHNTDPLRIAVFVLVAGLMSMALIFLVLFLRTHYKSLPAIEHIAQEVYRQLCKKLKRAGFAPELGETPHHFIGRVSKARPDLLLPLTRIIDLYEQLTYAEHTEVLMDLKHQLAQLPL